MVNVPVTEQVDFCVPVSVQLGVRLPMSLGLLLQALCSLRLSILHLLLQLVHSGRKTDVIEGDRSETKSDQLNLTKIN